MKNLDLKNIQASILIHYKKTYMWIKDFENSIGERFVVEGIGCNYSREVVPNKEEFEYCIVNRETVNWVNNNRLCIWLFKSKRVLRKKWIKN